MNRWSDITSYQIQIMKLTILQHKYKRL